jgi:ABC-type phosphate transport system permease subunit
VEDTLKRDIHSIMPDERTFRQRLQGRNRMGNAWRGFYYFSLGLSMLVLIVLVANVSNSAFGSIATTFEVEPTSLSGDGRDLSQVSEEELIAILVEHSGNKMAVLVRDRLSVVPQDSYTESTLREVLPNGSYPEGFADSTVNEIRDLDNAPEIFGEFLRLNMPRADIETLILENIVKLQVVASWPLYDALFNYESIVARVAEEYPDAVLTRYHSWLNQRFVQTPMSSEPFNAGIRTALLGSLLLMIIVIAVSLPVGVGAAVYLEEYAKDNILADLPKRLENTIKNWPLPGLFKRLLVRLTNLNYIIEINVRNLAGVPSIIYGMLGLAIFVRLLAPVTSGVAFGINVSVPEESRIIDLIDNALPLSFTRNEEGAITGIEESPLLSQTQALELVRSFRYFGTPSAINSGNLSPAQAEAEIAKVLGLSIVSQIPANADALSYTELRSGFINLSASSISAEQFSALVSQLQSITAFTINGRTVLSAALTLALLILPIIIINSQEALRAVPNPLREASYGLGATKWQTIWRTVLPAAIPGIMTGTILAVSRAVGETAPLIVVGASTFLLSDPTGPFSKFTVLPIQVYNWTSRPQQQFQSIAAAAIIVLLVLVLVLNTTAIILRNRYSQRY